MNKDIPVKRERRRGLPPVPDRAELEALLTEQQLAAMDEVGRFGHRWRLAFVRRPLFQEPTVVYRSLDTGNYLTLERDGRFNPKPDIVIR